MNILSIIVIIVTMICYLWVYDTQRLNNIRPIRKGVGLLFCGSNRAYIARIVFLQKNLSLSDLEMQRCFEIKAQLGHYSFIG